MGETLPDTIWTNNEKYDRLGREFVARLDRTDGTNVAKSLHYHFGQDERDWFYDRVWPYFSGLPQERWTRNTPIDAEIGCRNAVGFFQSVRGAAAATERGYVPVAKLEWYTDWLLRLKLGELAARQATEGWLPAFKQLDREGQLQLFSHVLGKWLPMFQGQLFLLNLYAPTLDLRVQATSARAFGDGSQAQELHFMAISMDERLGTALRQFSTGGCVYYVLESDQGLLITYSQEHGPLLHLWTQAEYAKEVNEGLYGGQFRISPMDYRELKGQLQGMQSAGEQYVTLDGRMNVDARVVPIGVLLQHVQKTINAVESSELGQMIKRGLEA